MNNVTFTAQGTKLIITVETNVPGVPSKSGKTTVLGSTHGFAKLDSVPSMQGISVGLNVIKEKK